MVDKIHNRMAYLTLCWTGCTLLIIGVATIKLGHLPRYGYDPAPAQLGLSWYTLLNMLLFVAAGFNAIIWPLILLAYPKTYKVNYYSVAAYLLGFISVFLLGFAPFEWYFD